MMSINRGSVRHEGGRINYFLVQLFESEETPESREFIFKLPEKDPRRFPLQWGMEYAHAWFATLPIGVWCEIGWPKTTEVKDG